MNIFWIVTDSICSYERNDLYGLLPTYKKLKNDKEGFFFENTLSQFTSTSLSLFSFFTGRFPYYIFPDFYRSIEFLPSYKYKNNVVPLKKKNFKIQAIMHVREAAGVFKDILNPYFKKNMYHGDHLLNAKETYNFSSELIKKLDRNENNFLYIQFRPTDPETDFYLNKLISLLKENDFWDNSIIIINSDHGYYDKTRYKKINLIHFNDIHQSSIQPALFMKIPPTLTTATPRTIKKRVYLIDVMETILDYLNIKSDHERESISFKDLIEKDINVNNGRMIRADCYLMFQPIKKVAIVQDDWKLLIDNEKINLYNLFEDLNEKKDIKEKNPKKFKDLCQFYQKTEIEAYKILSAALGDIYKKNILSTLKGENILIPMQFPHQLVLFLKEKLKTNNNLIESPKNFILNSDRKNDLITILFYNRLTGYKVRKLYRKYKKYTKKFLILDTKFMDVSDQINNTGYLKFIIKSLILRRKQLIQRWKEILVWVLYLPLYYNKYMRKYYN